MSEHHIPVLELGEIKDIETADRLGLTEVLGWQCLVDKTKYKEGDLIAYIPPDYVVDTTRPEFNFLNDGKKHLHRVRVIRLRGHISQGLVIHAPEGLSEGDNALETLGITRYEPPVSGPFKTRTEDANSPPGLVLTKYDIETYEKYFRLFEPGEPIVATEKLHGANARYVFWEGQFYAGSRTRWKKEYHNNLWWQAVYQNPWIQDWCEKHPNMVLYGEVFGQVQSLKYGSGPGDIYFAAFDVKVGNQFLDFDDFRSTLLVEGAKMAPLIYRGPFDLEKLKELAEEDSEWPGAQHLREGLVVKPVVERVHPRIGRLALKIVSNRYYLKG